jgi:hypothetical protein
VKTKYLFLISVEKIFEDKKRKELDQGNERAFVVIKDPQSEERKDVSSRNPTKYDLRAKKLSCPKERSCFG